MNFSYAIFGTLLCGVLCVIFAAYKAFLKQEVLDFLNARNSAATKFEIAEGAHIPLWFVPSVLRTLENDGLISSFESVTTGDGPLPANAGLTSDYRAYRLTDEGRNLWSETT